MIVIASDHAAYPLRVSLLKYFDKNKINYLDLGTNSLESVDYPDYGIKLGKAVMSGKYEYGIAMCGTGIGISIAANKVKGVRAALVTNEKTAALAKEHNNANVIAFGGRTTTLKEAIKIIKAFNKAKYDPRHQKRIDKITNYEAEKWVN